MKVLLVGDFGGTKDEGLRNVGHAIQGSLPSDVTRLQLDVSALGRRGSQTLGDPDIVHYVLGNTWKGVAFARLLGTFHTCPVVVTVLHPNGSPFIRGAPPGFFRFLSPLLRPNSITGACPSDCETLPFPGVTHFLIPNGVDLTRFRPLASPERTRLREKLSLTPTGPLVLHVGHVRHGRNLTPLLRLHQKGLNVVFVGSETQAPDPTALQTLKEAGIRVFLGYRPDIELLYAVADVYVHPTPVGRTLSMPLSVLEALASGLPVVTYPHPGLLHWIDNGPGLWYVRTEEELIAKTVQAVGIRNQEDMRAKVRHLSWERIGKMYAEAYQEVLT